MQSYRPLILALVLTLAAFAQADEPADRLVRQLQEQLQAGDHAAALATARALVDERPGLAGAWYNLAGLEAQEGTTARAEEAFMRAVQLGFDDFRHADRDEDLGSLRATSTYGDLRDAWRDGLAVRARDRRLELDAGSWSPSVDLVDRRGGLVPPEAEVRVRVDAGGLELDVLLGDETLPASVPWQAGGSGLLVAVTLPSGPAEGTLHREFGFGWLQKLPTGAVRLGERWQPLAELSPKMRVDHDLARLRMTVSIPWSACESLHPLADDVLLINVAYVRGHGDRPGRAALIEDPALGRPDRRWRRGVPLRVRWTDDGPAIAARLDDHVIRTPKFDVHVRATLPRSDAHGQAHLVLRDRRSTVVVDTDEALVDGRLEASLEAPALAGSARLGVSLATDRERALASWERSVVVLPPGWEERVERVIAAAPEHERPSLRHRQRAIDAALESRQSRDGIAALSGTVDELEAMLEAVEEHGTSLPAGGSYLAALPTADGREAVCSLALPDGWRRGDDATVVLLLARAPGAAERAVRRAPLLLHELAAGGEPAPVVLAIPRLGTVHDAEVARDHAARLVSWLQDFLGVDRILVAGVDLLAATALELAADRPAPLAGVLAITGVNFVPYPGRSEAWIDERLASIPADLPVGWLWFPDEIHGEDQSRVIRRLLTGSGRTLDPRERIPGGLGFEQAWSRAVVWAASFAGS
jgi:hypothetical protein